MPQPNMKKEYRAELKTLRRNRRTVATDAKAVIKIKLAEIKKLLRENERLEKSTNRHLARFDKRIAILEGRLS